MNPEISLPTVSPGALLLVDRAPLVAHLPAGQAGIERGLVWQWLVKLVHDQEQRPELN